MSPGEEGEIERMEEGAWMMRGLRLSEAEKRGLMLKKVEKGKVIEWAEDDLQAVGKLFSEKPVNSSVIGNTLGRIWCPIKGIDSRENQGRGRLWRMDHGCLTRSW